MLLRRPLAITRDQPTMRHAHGLACPPLQAAPKRGHLQQIWQRRSQSQKEIPNPRPFYWYKEQGTNRKGKIV